MKENSLSEYSSACAMLYNLKISFFGLDSWLGIHLLGKSASRSKKKVARALAANHLYRIAI